MLHKAWNVFEGNLHFILLANTIFNKSLTRLIRRVSWFISGKKQVLLYAEGKI